MANQYYPPVVNDDRYYYIENNNGELDECNNLPYMIEQSVAVSCMVCDVVVRSTAVIAKNVFHFLTDKDSITKPIYENIGNWTLLQFQKLSNKLFNQNADQLLNENFNNHFEERYLDEPALYQIYSLNSVVSHEEFNDQYSKLDIPMNSNCDPYEGTNGQVLSTNPLLEEPIELSKDKFASLNDKANEASIKIAEKKCTEETYVTSVQEDSDQLTKTKTIETTVETKKEENDVEKKQRTSTVEVNKEFVNKAIPAEPFNPAQHDNNVSARKSCFGARRIPMRKNLKTSDQLKSGV